MTKTGSMGGRMRRLWPALLVAGAMACESASAPEAPPALDAQAALQDYAALEQVFASEGWAGFQALAGRSPLSRASGISAMARVASVTEPTSARAFAVQLFRDLAAPAPDRSAIQLIDPVSRGQTFVYDAAIDNYRPDPARTGAPANGVRFILYAVGNANRPIGTQEIGYADLLDEGPIVGDEVALRLVAVERGRTMLDYRTRVVQQGDGAGRIEVSGFAADGAERLAFTIAATGEEVGGVTEVDLDFTLRLDPRAFQITGAVRGVDGSDDGDGTLSLTVRHGSSTLRVEATFSSGTVDGSVRVDDRLFVTITGDQAAPTVLGATGAPLTGEELLVVLHVIDVIDDVFDLVEDLLQPIDNLVTLAWIL
jgi:hypothetical protein